MAQSVRLLPPPNPNVLQARDIASITPGSIPQLLMDALSIRQTVFVEEQHVPAENELDSDDPRSWHWVVYASGSEERANLDHDGSSSEKQKLVTDGTSPVATIRLVPPPHEHHGNGGEGDHKGHEYVGDEMAGSNKSIWDGQEPYIKLGRLATLKEYRKTGLGHLLANTAIEWATQTASEINEQKEVAVAKQEESAERNLKWKGLILVHAQKNITERFWSSMGFVRDEGMSEWWEDGILHVGMWRRVQVN